MDAYQPLRARICQLCAYALAYVVPGCVCVEFREKGHIEINVYDEDQDGNDLLGVCHLCLYPVFFSLPFSSFTNPSHYPWSLSPVCISLPDSFPQ